MRTKFDQICARNRGARLVLEHPIPDAAAQLVGASHGTEVHAWPRAVRGAL